MYVFQAVRLLSGIFAVSLDVKMTHLHITMSQRQVGTKQLRYSIYRHFRYTPWLRKAWCMLSFCCHSSSGVSIIDWNLQQKMTKNKLCHKS